MVLDSPELVLVLRFRLQTPLSLIVCLAQPVRSAQFREPVITGSSTVAERSRYLLDRPDLLFQIPVGCSCSGAGGPTPIL
ncbi:hypothetical protein V6N11_033440 [Hibiscus sabdariffa]|uniref:Secreted protein n=1 Tax=Hibiscus sabdariffa TaxID=183260 RepID=A0ABR2PY19_9ROSI